MWLDVRDATNRPVPFWVRSEAGPTSWWEPGGPDSSARLTGAVVVVCGAWCVRRPHSRSSFRA